MDVESKPTSQRCLRDNMKGTRKKPRSNMLPGRKWWQYVVSEDSIGLGSDEDHQSSAVAMVFPFQKSAQSAP